MPPTVILETLTHADFEPLLDQGFRLAVPELPWTWVLREVRVSKATPPEGMRVPFTLMFKADPGLPRLRQLVLPLEHDTLGRLELLTNCCGQDPDGGFLYQASFN